MHQKQIYFLDRKDGRKKSPKIKKEKEAPSSCIVVIQLYIFVLQCRAARASCRGAGITATEWMGIH